MDRYIDKKQRRQLVPLSDSTVDRMERKGEFPRRHQISPGRVAWLESDLQAWLESRGAASSAQY